jgi:protein-disulfide isomerase
MILAIYFVTMSGDKKVDNTEGTETATEAIVSAPPVNTAETDKAPVANDITAAPVTEDLLSKPASLILDVPTLMKDRVLGNPNAPVTIIEYASLTCPHCAHFANTVLPEVKKQLIETGKAKLIFRDYPLDTFALRTAMMARCTDDTKYYDLIEVIFRNQDQWTKADDPLAAVTQLGTLAGMDTEYIKTCMESAEMEAYILRGVQEAQTKYGLKSTPTFVFNDGAETLSGGQSIEQFTTIVNKLTAGK